MCSSSFCSKRLKDNVSIHKPPKHPEIMKKWFNFVVKTRENVSKLNTVYVLCSDHFTEDDYTINPSQFGLLTSDETDVKFSRTWKRSSSFNLSNTIRGTACSKRKTKKCFNYTVSVQNCWQERKNCFPTFQTETEPNNKIQFLSYKNSSLEGDIWCLFSYSWRLVTQARPSYWRDGRYIK